MPSRKKKKSASPKTYSPEDIREVFQKEKDALMDIYWQLMAAGAGNEIARTVVFNDEYLDEYIRLKTKNYSDTDIVAYFVDYFKKNRE